MSQGILLFAHNNEQLNYGYLAVWQATVIKKYLNKPVTLVTDKATIYNLHNKKLFNKELFDSIVISDAETDQKRLVGTEWVLFKNIDRCNAYDLSPYDETIVMDTDILLQSDKLNLLWNSNADLLVSKDAYDVFDRTYPEFDYLKEHGIEFYWATEFYFKKCESSKLFFDTCKRIKDNYEWYAILYGMNNSPIRNDHVWSIALHELGGAQHGSWAETIPRILRFSIDKDTILKINDGVTIGTSYNGKSHVTQLTGQDVHLMNKIQLIEIIKKELGVEE
jgi:hypothetical protein